MPEFDEGSFRDPAGQVLYHRGEVLRTLQPAARNTVEQALSNGLLPELVDAGLVIGCRLRATEELGLEPAKFGDTVVVQDKVELVTYPYEWSFDMLRDAALVTLDVHERCLLAGYDLKDASAFNVLFHRNHPVLIDVLSIERRRDGSAWAGYAQFCRSFLFPLLVAAHRRVDAHRLLRGYMGELALQDTRRFFNAFDVFRPGVLKDVFLQAALDRSFAAEPERVAAPTQHFAVSSEVLLANLRRLRRIIARLRPHSRPTEWGEYERVCSYSEVDARTKASFVEAAVGRSPRDTVVDLGANTGTYSDLAAKHARRVVSVDIDPVAVNHLYKRLGPDVDRSVLLADLADPSPAMGWNLRERKPLLPRIRGDFFLALALVHHLRIGRNVPFDLVFPVLSDIAPEGVVEWVAKEDAMVRRLLAMREDVFDDYSWERFEARLRDHFEIVGTADTHGGNRRLCHVKAKLPRQ